MFRCDSHTLVLLVAAAMRHAPQEHPFSDGVEEHLGQIFPISVIFSLFHNISWGQGHLWPDGKKKTKFM